MLYKYTQPQILSGWYPFKVNQFSYIKIAERTTHSRQAAHGQLKKKNTTMTTTAMKKRNRGRQPIPKNGNNNDNSFTHINRHRHTLYTQDTVSHTCTPIQMPHMYTIECIVYSRVDKWRMNEWTEKRRKPNDPTERTKWKKAELVRTHAHTVQYGRK